MKKKPSNAPKNDEVPSLPIKNVDVLDPSGTTIGEKEAVPKGKPSKSNKTSCPESGDNIQSKTTSLSDLHEKKKEPKKNIPKSKSDENIAKAGAAKVAKNNTDGPTKETKSKQNESKSNKSQEKVTKHEEPKGSEKIPPKNKKTENNVESQIAVDTKDVVPVELSTVKEAVLGKADKSSSAVTASKKSSSAVTNEIPSGKTSSAIGSANQKSSNNSAGQKSSNNAKSGKKATNGDMKVLQKLSKCFKVLHVDFSYFSKILNFLYLQVMKKTDLSISIY